MPSTCHIVGWLKASADRFPQRPAVEDSSGRGITYAELADLSRRLHATLTAAGVGHGARVGVYMRKAVDALVAFNAILRSGAAYVPADPLAPAARAAMMFEDCEAAAVFVDAELADDLRRELETRAHRLALLVVPATAPHDGGWRIEALAAERPADAVPLGGDDLAFMLYTSGSTGKPKAVMLTHGNVVSFVDWCSGAFTPTERDRFATHAPLQFSLAVFNLYVAWKHGGTVVLIDEQAARVPALVGPIIERCGITVWFSTPTILSLLAQSGQLASLDLTALRLVMFGGETVPIGNVRILMSQLPHPTYVHVLGSTETHIMAHYVLPGPIASDRVAPLPIGTVAQHFGSRLLDDAGADAPPGTDGELCLSGSAVAQGYWRSPEDTARAFFTDTGGTRWYRTGDIVRVQPDGELCYRGRRDRMVKKRGNRIELAEIEACLSGNRAVGEVAVVAVADDELGLRVNAFVVPRAGAHPSLIDLKAHCASSLPAYMIPDTFTFAAALPRTATGKIDLPALRLQA